jgi:hypothetical protein
VAGKETGRREEGNSEVWEKSLEMRRFRIPYYGRAMGSAPAAASLRRWAAS